MHNSYFYIFLGSGIGGLIRYLITNLFSSNFPWVTLTVNISRSFLMGLIVCVSLKHHELASDNLQKFLMIVLCCGYASFSLFGFNI